MSSLPPVTGPEAPAPPPELPELPEGVELTPVGPRWAPWTAFVALIAAFGVALFGAIVMGIIAAALGADFDNPPPVVNLIATLVQDAALVGSAILFARMAGPTRPSDFGLRPPRTRRAAAGWLLLAWGVFIAFSAVWVALLGIQERDELPKELGVDEGPGALIAVAFLVTVVAPVAEEVFFRGYFFGALRNWHGLWPAAVITGLVFGGIHGGSSPIGFLVPLAFLGFVLCLLYARTGSLYPCIVLHSLNNSIAFGASEGWDWGIAVLAVASLVAIGVLLMAVRRRFGTAPPALRTT
jgi:CAAX protease family protein